MYFSNKTTTHARRLYMLSSSSLEKYCIMTTFNGKPTKEMTWAEVVASIRLSCCLENSNYDYCCFFASFFFSLSFHEHSIHISEKQLLLWEIVTQRIPHSGYSIFVYAANSHLSLSMLDEWFTILYICVFIIHIKIVWTFSISITTPNVINRSFYMDADDDDWWQLTKKKPNVSDTRILAKVGK